MKVTRIYFNLLIVFVLTGIVILISGCASQKNTEQRRNTQPKSTITPIPTKEALNYSLALNSNDLIYELGIENYILKEGKTHALYTATDSNNFRVRHIGQLDNCTDLIKIVDYGSYVGVFKNGDVKSWSGDYFRGEASLNELKGFKCKKIAGSNDQLFYLKKDGTVWYTKGIRENFDKAFNISPKQAVGLNGIVDIAVNDNFGSENTYVAVKGIMEPYITSSKDSSSIYESYLIALTSKGEVIGWNNYEKNPRYKVLYKNKDIIDIEARSGAIFALTKDGTLYRWGNNYNGLLGMGKKYSGEFIGALYIKKPQKMSLPGKVKQVSLGYSAGAAVLEDGSLWSWGCDKPKYESDDFPWQNISKDFYPSKVSLNGKAIRVYVGDNSAIAYMQDKSIKIWGESMFSDELVGKGSSSKDVRKLDKIVVKNGEAVNVDKS